MDNAYRGMRYVPAKRPADWSTDCPQCGVTIQQGEPKERLSFLVGARSLSKIWHRWCQQAITPSFYSAHRE